MVEFSSQPYAGSSEETLILASAAYLEFIAAEEADNVDIMVFPESTLNNFQNPFEVPDPAKTGNVVCNNDQYHKTMQAISCAAKQKRRYIVINVTERSTETGTVKHYNTNVVFDRNGSVVSRYRKWNLYGELNMDLTEIPDLSFFTTDFNVTFGHFICFDIMFHEPALKLVELGITDIIYPTMWFGQLPFLTGKRSFFIPQEDGYFKFISFSCTGIQTQAMWSFKNKVNFLSAGAGNPNAGSTGTGIFSGKYGPLKTLMSPTPQRKMLVAKVLKSEFWGDQNEDFVIPSNPHFYTTEDMAHLFLKRDNLELYSTTPMLAGSDGVVVETVCYEQTCCHFNIQVTERKTAPNTEFYKYRLTAFDGVKSRRGTLTCAVVACTDSTLASCGHRFEVGTQIDAEINFESIVISTTFAGHTFNMPNVVDLAIMPIPYEELSFYESATYIYNG